MADLPAKPVGDYFEVTVSVRNRPRGEEGLDRWPGWCVCCGADDHLDRLHVPITSGDDATPPERVRVPVCRACTHRAIGRTGLIATEAAMFHIGWIAFVMVLVIGGVAYWPWLLVTAIVSMVGGLLRFRRRARRRARAREGHHTALLVGFGLQGWFVQTTHPALVRHLHAAYGDDVSVA